MAENPQSNRRLATLVLTRSSSSPARPAVMVRIAYSENPFACSAVIAGLFDAPARKISSVRRMASVTPLRLSPGRP